MFYKNRNSKWLANHAATFGAPLGLMAMMIAAIPVTGQELTSKTENLTIKSENLISATVDRGYGKFIPTDFPMDVLSPKEPETFNLYLLNEKSAQENTTVKGTVRSSKTKELLPGANVVVAGTSHGATTDINGAFELNEVPVDSKLAISYVGYETREVEITKKNQAVNVVLEWQRTALDKVVVVSYGEKHEYRPWSTSDSIENQEKEKLTVLEQMPEFPGGQQELYRYLGKNIRYPSEAYRNDLEGRVVVTFTVNENGRIRNPRITESLGGGTDEEVLLVVLKMSSWKPGQQNGLPVPMEYVLPIDFRVDRPETKEEKEKRQGKANTFRTSRMSLPGFKFEDAVDFGIPSGGGPNNSMLRGVSMPTSIYSSERWFHFFIPKDTVIPADSTKPARFFNYRNPYIRSKN